MNCWVCGKKMKRTGHIHVSCIPAYEPDDTKERREKKIRLVKATAELIESVVSSPIALARLSGPIEKR